MTDPGPTLVLLRIVKLVLEIALLALAGRGVLFVLIRGAGADPARNIFYKVLEVIALPFVRLVRLVTPRFVIDRHIAWATFALLAFAWITVAFSAIPNACINAGLTPTCQLRR